MTPGRAIPVQLAEPLKPARKGGGEDPDWVKVGAEVFIQRYGWREATYIKCKIVRITATRVVMDDRFETWVNRQNLTRYSGDTWSGTSTHLLSITDERARSEYYKQWRKNIRLETARDVQEALKEWENSGATSAVDEMIEALQLAQSKISQTRKQEKGI